MIARQARTRKTPPRLLTIHLSATSVELRIDERGKRAIYHSNAAINGSRRTRNDDPSHLSAVVARHEQWTATHSPLKIDVRTFPESASGPSEAAGGILHERMVSVVVALRSVPYSHLEIARVEPRRIHRVSLITATCHGPGERESGRSYGGDRDRGYRPMTGDYGRGTDYESEQFFAASGYGRSDRGMGGRGRDEDRFERDRSQSEWGRDPYRRTSRAGTSDWSDRSRHEDRGMGDPHYDSWKQRHISDLDRDYDDYRRENRSRFEDDFSSWRERRQQKRGLLGQIREHMDVVGSDNEHVGTVDKVAGDRIILTKSDAESGGVHHSLSCSDINRVEGNRVILDCSAEQSKQRWRDESRGRALFERDDQGEMGPRSLDRSFSGTYR